VIAISSDHILGVLNPSPLNTWPRWPPQAVQVISMRVTNIDLSSWRLTAPGIATSLSEYGVERRKDAPVTVEESRPATAARELGGALVERGSTPSAGINPLFLVVFVFSSARAFRALLAQNLELLWGQDRPPLRLRFLAGSVGHGRCL
jgi:hypothetical protein